MSHRRGGAQRPVAMPPTAPPSRDGPSSAPSRFFRPPPPPPSQSDPFDFILEECGHLSLSQEAHLRNAAPFLRQEKLNPANLPRDERSLGYHILYRVFGFENPHHHRGRRRPPYTDAEAAELALSDYSLALGPRRVHLLQTPPKEGKRARAAGTRAAAKKGPEGMPPPAEVPPSRRLGAAAPTPATPAEGGKDKLAGTKRARDDFSKPPRSLSHAAGERSAMGKKTCANPDPVNPPAGRSSPCAGVTSTGDAPAVGGRPPSADGGGRRRRNLPPSISCPDDWEDARTTGYERGSTRLRPVPPPPQVDQRAKGKAPAAGAVPCPSSSLNARTSSSADAAGVTEPGLEKGGASGRPSSSSTATVHVAPPPSARTEATSPSAVGSGGDSLSAFIEALVRFSNRPKPPNQTPEKADPLEALAKGAFSMPAPKWWRPGGYGGRPDK